jgi:hypothetical protein
MKYKIYFGSDEKLRELANDLFAELNLKLTDYETIIDAKLIKGIRKQNSEKINTATKNILEAKRQKIINYLDEKHLSLLRSKFNK